MGQADQRSHSFVSAKCQAGATLEATEDGQVRLLGLLETLDLQRCLMVPMASSITRCCSRTVACSWAMMAMRTSRSAVIRSLSVSTPSI